MLSEIRGSERGGRREWEEAEEGCGEGERILNTRDSIRRGSQNFSSCQLGDTTTLTSTNELSSETQVT